MTLPAFKIEVFESSARVLEVNAKSAEEAQKMVEDLYRAGTIILDENDFQNVEFNII